MPQVDAFAAANNRQLERYWARQPEPEAEAVDGLAQPLDGLHIWANPPWALIPALLARIQASPACRATLVLPAWRSAFWWPSLLRLAADIVIISPEEDLFLPGFTAGRPIGRPHWSVALAFVPSRA
jgi:hypothetical protein